MYFTYGSTANFLFIRPTTLTCICTSKERHCNEGLCGVGNFIIEQAISDSYSDFSEGQLNIQWTLATSLYFSSMLIHVHVYEHKSVSKSCFSRLEVLGSLIFWQ